MFTQRDNTQPHTEGEEDLSYLRLCLSRYDVGSETEDGNTAVSCGDPAINQVGAQTLTF